MAFLQPLIPGAKKLTVKIKTAIRIVFLLMLALLLSLYLSERKQNDFLQKKQRELVNQLHLKELKTEISRAKTRQTKVLSQKPDAKIIQGSADSCQSCFKNYNYRVSVKDESGRWIFEDENVFDEKPGKLTLTERFWNEIERETTSDKNSQNQKPFKSERPKNRILAGFELDRVKIEYAYSPLGVKVNKSELNIIFYSALSMTYSYIPLEARTGIGIEIRF